MQISLVKWLPDSAKVRATKGREKTGRETLRDQVSRGVRKLECV